MVIRDLTALAAASARGIHCSCPAQQALNFNPAQRVRMAHQARRWVETERRFEKLVQPTVDAFNACEPAGVGAWGLRRGGRGDALG